MPRLSCLIRVVAAVVVAVVNELVARDNWRSAWLARICCTALRTLLMCVVTTGRYWCDVCVSDKELHDCNMMVTCCFCVSMRIIMPPVPVETRYTTSPFNKGGSSQRIGTSSESTSVSWSFASFDMESNDPMEVIDCVGWIAIYGGVLWHKEMRPSELKISNQEMPSSTTGTHENTLPEHLFA